MASRTQVTLTFVKMFALVLIIVPGGIALARGGRMSSLILRIQMFFPAVKVLSNGYYLMMILSFSASSFFPGKTESFQNGFEVDSFKLDTLPLAFYNGLYAYGGW